MSTTELEQIRVEAAEKYRKHLQHQQGKHGDVLQEASVPTGKSACEVKEDDTTGSYSQQQQQQQQKWQSPKRDETGSLQLAQDVCAICLEPARQPAHCDTCFHCFCLKCITEWCKVQLQDQKHGQVHCPLCKLPFYSLIYDIKHQRHFKRYYFGSNGPANDPRTRKWGPSVSYSNQEFQLRLNIYAHGLRNCSAYVNHSVGSTWPHSQLQLEEIRRWMRRELMILLQDDDVQLLVTFFMGCAQQFGLNSSRLRDELVPFLSRDVSMFLEELKAFILSGQPCGIYDRRAVYQLPPVAKTEPYYRSLMKVGAISSWTEAHSLEEWFAIFYHVDGETTAASTTTTTTRRRCGSTRQKRKSKRVDSSSVKREKPSASRVQKEQEEEEEEDDDDSFVKLLSYEEQVEQEVKYLRQELQEVEGTIEDKEQHLLQLMRELYDQQQEADLLPNPTSAVALL